MSNTTGLESGIDPTLSGGTICHTETNSQRPEEAMGLRTVEAQLDSIEMNAEEQIRSSARDHLPSLVSKLFQLPLQLKPTDDSLTKRIVSFQESIIRAVLTRLLADRAGEIGVEIPPKPLQVLVLVRLLVARRDQILVAGTGFGKSLIFQAIGILLGQITIIVVPLLGLSDQIRDDIDGIPGAKPIVVSSETRRQYSKMLLNQKPRDIYDAITEGSYTHIILGPEQLVDPRFRALVREAGFRDRIGALVVDEAHCVSLWSSFRAEYAQIHAFRRILPRNVVIFACTATLNPSLQSQMIQKIGFDQKPDWDQRLGVVRTSTDRPDISVVVLSLPSKNLFAGILFSIRIASTCPEPVDDVRPSSAPYMGSRDITTS
jgi:DEAD/DEAH box helicase